VCGNPLLCRDRVAIVSLFVQLEASHEAIVSQDIPKNTSAPIAQEHNSTVVTV
jgi:hypothetical protein